MRSSLLYRTFLKQSICIFGDNRQSELENMESELSIKSRRRLFHNLADSYYATASYINWSSIFFFRLV